MKHKIISILLVTVMTIGLFAGCGQKNNPVGSTENASETGSEQEASDQQEEIPTLRIFSVQPTGYEDTDLNENYTVLWLEKELGINLEFELVPSDVASERITLAISSGNLPDIFYFGNNVLSTDDVLKYGQSGVFQSLDENFEELFPNLYAFMTENVSGGTKSIYEADGHIYSLPGFNDVAHEKHPMKLWTNQMFLDALDMDMPETLDEFEAYLIGVKENDVNGNGDPNDEVGLVGQAGNTTWYRAIINSFVYAPSTGSDVTFYIDNATNEVLCSNVQDGYREGLRYINKLWEQGLVYEESFTMSQDQVTTLYMSEEPVIGALGFFAPFIYDTTYSTPTYSQLRIQTPLTNYDGEAGISPYGANSEYSMRLTSAMITSACENIEAAAKFLDYHYTLENTMNLLWGPDDGTREQYVEMAQEGDLNCVGEPALYRNQDYASRWEDNHALTDWQIRFNLRELYFGSYYDDSQDLYGNTGVNAVLQSATDILHEYASDEYSTIPATLRISEEASQTINDIRTQLDSYTAQWETEFIMGDKSLDDDWEEYVNGMYEFGLQNVIDEYSAAINR